MRKIRSCRKYQWRQRLLVGNSILHSVSCGNESTDTYEEVCGVRCAVCGVRCVLCVVSTLTFHWGGEGGLKSKLNQAFVRMVRKRKRSKVSEYREKSPLRREMLAEIRRTANTSHQKKAHRTRFETYVSIADLHILYRCDCARFTLRPSLGNLRQSADSLLKR